MQKHFCITGTCIPKKHYIVDMNTRIEFVIHEYIEKGRYFTINRARQLGAFFHFQYEDMRVNKSEFLSCEQGKSSDLLPLVLYDITESEVTSWQIILIYNPQI